MILMNPMFNTNNQCRLSANKFTFSLLWIFIALKIILYKTASISISWSISLENDLNVKVKKKFEKKWLSQ